MALSPDRTRRQPFLGLLALAVIGVLVLGACSSDGGDDASTDAEESTTSTTAAAGGDDSTTSTAEAGDEIGMVEVDGEVYALDRIIGVTSCAFDDPEGAFTVAARSDDAFLRLDSYASDPGNGEFTVTVGEIELVSESPSDVVYEVDGKTVSGTIPVVPLFEEGTAQDVTFEVTCP